MSKFLPTSGFKWIDPKEADLNNYTSSSSKGCVFEIDFEYSIKLQKLHNDYPLAPVKSETKKKKKMLSEYQPKVADLGNIPISNVRKLVFNLFDKEKYVIHYENVQLYLRLGLKLKKLHQVLGFNQPDWLKPYIEFNTQKRIEAEKDNDQDGKML